MYQDIRGRDRPFSYSENIELFTVSKRDILDQATIIGMYKKFTQNKMIVNKKNTKNLKIIFRVSLKLR